MINQSEFWTIVGHCLLFKVQRASIMTKWIFPSWWDRSTREHMKWPLSMATPETATRTKGICQRRTSRQQQWTKATSNSSICSTKSPRPSATPTPSRPPRAETSHKLTKKTRPRRVAPQLLSSRPNWVQGRKKKTLRRNLRELIRKR